LTKNRKESKVQWTKTLFLVVVGLGSEKGERAISKKPYGEVFGQSGEKKREGDTGGIKLSVVNKKVMV